MTDMEKIRRIEYKSHVLQVKTCKALMDLMVIVAGDDTIDTVDQAKILADLSKAVANVGGRVPQ